MLMFLATAAALPIVPDARFALALYCNPTCTDTVLDDLDAALAPIASADSFSDHVAVPQRIMGIGGVDFGIPDADFVEAYGVGVDRPASLAASQEVVLAWFAGPREQSVETFAKAHAAFAAAARSTGGWVEDLDTQILFGAEAWAARDPRGSLQSWFVVDETSAPDNAERLRLVTRGLRRYGDFELLMDEVPSGGEADAGWALDAVATALHPLAEVSDSLEVRTESAEGIARLEEATPGEDDPAAPLLRVRFEWAAAKEAAPPPPDPPAPAPAPAAPPSTLAEARAAVAQALVALGPTWAGGLPRGDTLAVSTAFTTREGGKEYLWVEVTDWKGGELSGRLATEPAQVEGLRKGDEVNVRLEAIFDYVVKHADGRKEGNVTRPFR
ncbi:MAG: DUF2314 domain-containing protein [Myxococcales bacterium]|nr:DUF2314 domain-containing protein [Myxococcales bacterium]